MNSKYEIVRFNPGQDYRSLYKAVRLTLYSEDQLEMKLSESINNDYLHCVLILLHDDIAVGSACIYHNPHLVYHGKKAVCIGNYECQDSHEAASLLLQTATEEAKKLQAAWLIGPMNGSTWDTYRFSLYNTQHNFFLEPYHHTYYNKQFINAGFDEIAQYESRIDRKMELSKVPDFFRPEGITLRPLHLSDFEAEIDRLYPFCIDTFSDNFLYTPVSREAFADKYLPVKPFIDSGLAMLAEDRDGDIAALFFCLPDYSNPGEKRVIIKTVARRRGRQYAGLVHLLCNEVIDYARKQGYKSMVHSFMHVHNQSANISSKYSGETYKQYTLYARNLS